MFPCHGEIPPALLLTVRRCVSAIALALLVAAAVMPAHAQGNFNSGSGADGAFNPPSGFTLQIPESGVLNFTTITINGDLFFRANSRNTPVTLLATGDVIISGRIFLDGGRGTSGRLGGLGGPGGFRGGDAGSSLDNFNGTAGDGPGGGTGGRGTADHASPGAGGGGGFSGGGANGGGVNPGQGGPSYGTRNLLPLIGGSGGGGGSAYTNGFGGGGGGGGGAILIASSGTITFTSGGTGNGGQIYARGASGNDVNGSTCCPPGGGGGGAGGAIRLVANRISGSPFLTVSGAGSDRGGGAGAQGYIRAEAFDLTAFTPSASSSLTLGQPNPAILPNMPQLRIASIGGVAAPALPNGSFHALPDIVVPTSQPNPVTVVIQASNIPNGSNVQVTLTPDSGTRTTVTTSLTGGNATVSVTLPTTGLAVITAATTYDVVAALGKPLFIDGERIDRIEVAATFGGTSQLTYITRSGKRIKM